MWREWWTDGKMYWQEKDEEIKGSRERFRCTSGMSSTMNVMGVSAVPQSHSTIALSWRRNRSRHLHASLALPIQSCHDEHENGALSGSITWGMVENRGRLSGVLHRNWGWYSKRFLWSGCSHGKKWTSCINQNSNEGGWGRMLAARLKRGPKKVLLSSSSFIKRREGGLNRRPSRPVLLSCVGEHFGLGSF